MHTENAVKIHTNVERSVIHGVRAKSHCAQAQNGWDGHAESIGGLEKHALQTTHSAMPEEGGPRQTAQSSRRPIGQGPGSNQSGRKSSDLKWLKSEHPEDHTQALQTLTRTARSKHFKDTTREAKQADGVPGSMRTSCAPGRKNRGWSLWGKQKCR